MSSPFKFFPRGTLYSTINTDVWRELLFTLSRLPNIRAHVWSSSISSSSYSLLIGQSDVSCITTHISISLLATHPRASWCESWDCREERTSFRRDHSNGVYHLHNRGKHKFIASFCLTAAPLWNSLWTAHFVSSLIIYYTWTSPFALSQSFFHKKRFFLP